MQRLHQPRALLQHGALVDGALVGDFAFVDGRRLVHQVQPGDAVGAAAAGLPEAICHDLEEVEQRGVCKHIGGAGAVGKAGELAAFVQPGQQQGADLGSVQARQPHILHQRATFCHHPRAQRANADEGAGVELEVFGDAAVEEQAGLRVGCIHPAQGIARSVEACFVEGFRTQRGFARVAGHDVRAAEADFGLGVGAVAIGHQLHFHTGARQVRPADPTPYGSNPRLQT